MSKHPLMGSIPTQTVMCQQLGPGWLGVWGAEKEGAATDQTGEGTGACPKHPLISPSRDDKQGQT